MKERIILDLCGGTGAWSKPYKDAGYAVKLVTLPECDIRKTVVSNSAIWFIDEHGKLVFQVSSINVWGILAAPPCTMFSFARQRAKTPRDFSQAIEVVEACLKIIWQCKIAGGLKWWALENPRGYLRHFLGRPHYTFQQWQFDAFAQHNKTTDVWGNFKEPRSAVRKKPKKTHTELDKSWQNPARPDWTKSMQLDRAAVRAITPSGFAQAFFQANR